VLKIADNKIVHVDELKTVWPVDRWCRYQPVASSSKHSFPRTRSTLSKLCPFWKRLFYKLIIELN